MTADSLLPLGDLIIKTDMRKVFRNGRAIPLRRKEYELLEFMAKNKKKVLNRLTILEYVWNYGSQVATNTLDVHMASLRHKIRRSKVARMITTVYGLGYMLNDAPNRKYSNKSELDFANLEQIIPLRGE